jgi:hypothetical protein
MVLLPHDKEYIQLGKNMLPIAFLMSRLIEVYLVSKNGIGRTLSRSYFNSMNWMFWMEILSNCTTSLWSHWYYVSMMQRITWKNCRGFLSHECFQRCFCTIVIVVIVEKGLTPICVPPICTTGQGRMSIWVACMINSEQKVHFLFRNVRTCFSVWKKKSKCYCI